LKSAAAIDVRELLAAIAKRHGVFLSEEDPVLVTVTLNELVLGEYVRLLTKGVEEAQRAVAQANAEHVEATRVAVAKMVASLGEWLSKKILDSGKAVHDQLQTIARDAEAAAAHARNERAAAEQAAAAAARARRQACWAALAVVVVLLASLGMAWLRDLHVAAPPRGISGACSMNPPPECAAFQP
jgi:hypothetical protein